MEMDGSHALPVYVNDKCQERFIQTWKKVVLAFNSATSQRGRLIDPLQLTSSIREYGKGHQHGGYLALAASMAISVSTMLLVCVESDEI